MEDRAMVGGRGGGTSWDGLEEEEEEGIEEAMFWWWGIQRWVFSSSRLQPVGRPGCRTVWSWGWGAGVQS